MGKDLYVVDFNYLEAGYITGFSYTGNARELVAISDDGKFFINQAIPVYERYIPFIVYVMSLSDKQLHSKVGYYEFFRKAVPRARKLSNKRLAAFLADNDFKSIESMYNDIKGWELKRREVKKRNLKKGVI